MQTLKDGAVHFTFVFSAGFMPGTAQALGAAPRLTACTPELMEARVLPLMKDRLALFFWPILFFFVPLSRELASPALEPEQAGGEKLSGSVSGLA